MNLKINDIRRVLAITDSDERNSQALALLRPNNEVPRQSDVPQLEDVNPEELNHLTLPQLISLLDDETLLPDRSYLLYFTQNFPNLKLRHFLRLTDLFIATRLQPDLLHDFLYDDWTAEMDYGAYICENNQFTIRDLLCNHHYVTEAIDVRCQHAPVPPPVKPPPILPL